MGRPSLYSPELITTICDRLSKGEPLAAICRDEGMPDPATIWQWLMAALSFGFVGAILLGLV